MQGELWRALCPLGILKLQTHSWVEVYKQLHNLRRHDVEAASALERKERDVLGCHALSARGLPPGEAASLPMVPTSPSCGNFSPRFSPSAPDSPVRSSDWDSPSFFDPDPGPSAEYLAAVGPFPGDISRTDGKLVEGLHVSNEALMQDAAALLRLLGELERQIHRLGGQDEVDLSQSAAHIGATTAIGNHRATQHVTTEPHNISRAARDATSVSYLSGALGRYERFLSLKAKHPDVLLVPTRDIEAVWISHLIRPYEYMRDCKSLFRVGMMDHSLRCSHYEASSWPEALRNTSVLWQAEFGEPYGGYDCYVEDELARAACDHRDWEARLQAYTQSVERLEVNFENAAAWKWGSGYEMRLDAVPPPPLRLLCCDGLWGASPHATHRMGDLQSEPDSGPPDHSTMRRASLVPTAPRAHRISFSATEAMQDIGWYRKFCKWFEDHSTRMRTDVRSQSSNMPLRWQRGYHRMLFFARSEREQRGSCRLHPPPGVDLFWHAHMLSPTGYRNDCERLLGRLLAHHPWPREHADRSVASADGSDFVSRWEESFGREPDHDLCKADVQLPAEEKRRLRLAQIGFPPFVLQCEGL